MSNDTSKYVDEKPGIVWSVPERVEILPKDIRKGDLIRWEAADGAIDSLGFAAAEYRAAAHHFPWTTRGTHYLLDRPTPPFELPTVPTFGWVVARGDIDGVEHRTEGLAVWCVTPDGLTLTEQEGRYPVPAAHVTCFTPATAVPTEALDALRKYRRGLDASGPTPALNRIDTFLAAVDTAGTR